MFSQILAAIVAIPKLIGVIQELLLWFKRADDEKWFADKTEAIRAIKDAKTEQEFKDAAKKFQDVLRGI